MCMWGGAGSHSADQADLEELTVAQASLKLSRDPLASASSVGFNRHEQASVSV